MPLWPFHRKKRRESAQISTPSTPSSEHPPTTPLDYNHNATLPSINTAPVAPFAQPTAPTSDSPIAHPPSIQAASIQSRESQRKRRRSPETPLDAIFSKDALAAAGHPFGANAPNPGNPQSQQTYSDQPFHPSQVPMPDLSQHDRLFDVPHLEPVSHANRPSSRSAAAPRKKRLSKRKEIQDMAIREEEIRAMSAQSNLTHRSSVHGDLLRRDSKRGSRTFRRSRSENNRDSTASLPVQGSQRSSISDSNGWEISALDFFNPRPTVRYSGLMPHSSSMPSGIGSSRQQHGLDRLPPVNEHVSKKSRSKISDLADDFDATDLRVLMERDQRRKEKKKSADFDKLDQSLQRIPAEKERDSRIAGTPPRRVEPPTDVHPAFRDSAGNTPQKGIGRPPLSPISLNNEKSTSAAAPQQASSSEDPFSSPEIEVRDNEVQTPALTASSPNEVFMTPLGTPGLEQSFNAAPQDKTAVVSQGNLSPPQSPHHNQAVEKQSPLRREVDPDAMIAPPVPPKDNKDDRRFSRGGTWTQFFRRGDKKNARQEARPTSEMSFSNTSRESMSRQPLPAHLLATTAAAATAPTKRDSGTAPARKQSVFREELSDSPNASPNTRMKNLDATVIAGNAALARRQKQKTPLAAMQEASTQEEAPAVSRTESPIDVAMTASLASIDSEGSWLTGRHPSTRSVRKSVHSQLRNSIGSLNRQSKGDGFNGSYEDLSMTEESHVRQQRPMSPQTDATSTLGDLPDRQDEEDDGMIKRRDTNRKTPTLVHNGLVQYKSREGLVADYLSGAAFPTSDLSRPGTAMSTVMSDGRESPTDPNLLPSDASAVEYGHGHARQFSTGSAKLLYIPSSSQSPPTEARSFTRPKSMPPL